MARKPRVYYSEALYHAILRGNAGQDSSPMTGIVRTFTYYSSKELYGDSGIMNFIMNRDGVVYQQIWVKKQKKSLTP